MRSRSCVSLVVESDSLTIYEAGGVSGSVAWPGHDTPAEIGRCTEELQAVIPSRAEVRVVLMPSVADTRVARFPKVRARDLPPLVEMNASRFFPDQRSDGSVSWRRLGRTADRPVLVARMNAEVQEVLSQALAGLDVEVGAPVLAVECWARLAADLELEELAVQQPWGFLMVELRDGEIREVSRVSSTGVARRWHHQPALPTKRSARGILGAGAGSEFGLDALTAEACLRLADDPAATASRSYSTRSAIAVLTSTQQSLRRRAARRRDRLMWLSAAALLVVAGVFESARLGRLGAQVESARQEHSRLLAEALRSREALSAAEEWLEGTSEFRARGDALAVRLGQVAAVLPDGTLLASVRGTRGEIELEGSAPNVEEIVAGLEATADVQAVDFVDPVRRETAGGESVDQFRLTVRVGARGR